jgi:hypothetical protein
LNYVSLGQWCSRHWEFSHEHKVLVLTVLRGVTAQHLSWGRAMEGTLSNGCVMQPIQELQLWDIFWAPTALRSPNLNLKKPLDTIFRREPCLVKGPLPN